MKKFRYRFTLPMLLCVLLLLALTAGGFAWNLINALSLNGLEISRLISCIFVCVVSAVLFLLGIGVLFFSRYVVGNGKFVSRFCFFRTEVKADSILQVTHFKKSDKLVVYFTDKKYVCVVIDPKQYEAFCAAVKAENPSAVINDRTDGDTEKPA